MKRGTRVVIRGRRLEAECDGLGRGYDVLGYNCETLIESMGCGTPAVSYGERLGVGWCVHVFISNRSRKGHEGRYCRPKGGSRLRQGQSYPEAYNVTSGDVRSLFGLPSHQEPPKE